MTRESQAEQSEPEIPRRRESLGERLGVSVPDSTSIPPRILNYIQQRQDASEIVIGWVQLAVVVLFGTLFIFSPKGSTGVEWEPVPWALAIYLVFTLARLLLAYRGSLPPWILLVSIVVDMSLLMALIWSFHLHYDQPPSFYLKVPTLLYVFVFITLRALRFEVRYVIAAGVVAVLGWSFNVGYAVMKSFDGSDQPMMITRDYVQYMTSNSIMIGAELDKIISIIVVTAILVFVVARARVTLIRAFVEQTAALELSRFVPSELVQTITTSEQSLTAGQTERSEATILFIDIEGFTGIGETMEPEQLVSTLNEYFAAVCAPIRALDGVITQFQGDAILASFNLPTRNPDHATNAVRAGREILKILETQKFHNGLTLRSRIGITSGSVVGGLVGTDDRVGYTVHGDVVNLAARLEQKNKELGTRILVSAATAKLVRESTMNFDEFVSAGDLEIRGHRGKVEAFTLKSDLTQPPR